MANPKELQEAAEAIRDVRRLPAVQRHQQLADLLHQAEEWARKEYCKVSEKKDGQFDAGAKDHSACGQGDFHSRPSRPPPSRYIPPLRYTPRLLSEGIAFAEFNGGAFKGPIIAIGQIHLGVGWLLHQFCDQLFDCHGRILKVTQTSVVSYF